jgi:hypothetical protein
MEMDLEDIKIVVERFLAWWRNEPNSAGLAGYGPDRLLGTNRCMPLVDEDYGNVIEAFVKDQGRDILRDKGF